MRLGVYGGSFDPVHYGHLLLVETCREQLRLDEVHFFPAAIPPHKQSRSLAPNKERVEMLELALAGNPHLKVSTLEIERGGVSYTVDTLSELKQRYPEAELFFLMGGDSLADLPTWRQPAKICELATPVVVARTGALAADFGVLSKLVAKERIEEIQNQQVHANLIEISSTDIRQRVAQDRSIRFRTPRSVEKYIGTHKLYRNGLLRG